MSGMYRFAVGQSYTRKDVFRILGIPDPKGGIWYTGYASHGNDWFIFCGVGTTGRTGHDYQNRFLGTRLVWYGKNRTRLSQPAMKSMLNPVSRVYVFYREDNEAPFQFAGIGKPTSVRDISPVEIIWDFTPSNETTSIQYPDEIIDPETITEGARKAITVNVYERDPHARRRCLEHWGTDCYVCGFSFHSRYGDLGVGYIHVHHLRPLSEIGREYELDPISDLRPVCPNCHAMLHRRSPVLSPDELRALLLVPLCT